MPRNKFNDPIAIAAAAAAAAIDGIECMQWKMSHIKAGDNDDVDEDAALSTE